MSPSSSSNNTNMNNNQDPTTFKKRRKQEESSTMKKQKNDPSIETSMDHQVVSKFSEETLVRDLFNQRNDLQLDHSNLILKKDHVLRPIWICSDVDERFHIFMETCSPIYLQAYDFLVAIAEPISRLESFHEYILTEYSLFAAVSIGMNTEHVIQMLDKLSKVQLPDSLINFITEVTRKYGNVKLVLQKNRFFMESQHLSVMEKLLEDSIIRSAAVSPSDRTEFPNIDSSGRFIIKSKPLEIEKFQKQALISNTKSVPFKIQTEMIQVDHDQIDNYDNHDDDCDMSSTHVITNYYQFEIHPNQVEHVKKRCIEIGLPTLEEYDFRNDSSNKSLRIDLKPTTTIRSYQEKSLSKMFSNGRARSGIIVLPCGAGKTLVGVTAACTVKKRTLVLCINSVSVLQWKNQFKLWSTIDERQVIVFTSQEKDSLPKEELQEPLIIITTYSMLTQQHKRSGKSKEMMNYIQSREWGLLILDEVHVVPAHQFRNVSSLKSHCKLGLTATLVREDSRIDDLYFLIGPKLYEANWLDLQKKGHLAHVQCVEVWCPMTAEFYAEYLIANAKKKTLLYVMNPNKFRACEFLIRYHEKQGDKIIVFSDNVFSLEQYATKLKLPFICGNTTQQERIEVLNRFRQGRPFNTLFMSKVGDTAIDIPEATVIIEISSHFGSRRQEAQRLGRILRPKAGGLNHQHAYFYTLVSQDTREMFYSTKRQQFLINQGYKFRVLPDIEKYYEHCASGELGLSYGRTTINEKEWLGVVKAARDACGDEEKVDDESNTQQASISMAQLSGGQGVVYHVLDGNTVKNKRNKSTVSAAVHPLFKNRNSSSKY
ncbi:hypothetical protein C9374_009309 [Naegleria lovaniensis]|uniref:DNA 3'-5' helicase n=1 Tax=Naegleria lovaniensis TaxID=51637 RepID=A0AA88KH32_NAELO|nr:uncharacterized protein C9374_009309 [Naegleria lovaniensis]KAG2377398.1 hypothetical protein C9374_009309 [Naegleria lovaniensis]